ncbi:AAA family ATPase [Mycobacterium sp. CVI_P3]|uniref:AAA family ATPase n=1 Tax=Mycobacterium pinniadriaticum TaxID=2994102 RepID=A0ABT3SQH3_9MYCO|nr:AAA family ATPase [Mycobacterium pinniadriaticum]MCX2934708.1 AAA family ATPase [Mycobacterium pinniadriaticum]MCX2941140.1 AAA family ATPase [Mycobacterium pinniadriaticum]
MRIRSVTAHAFGPLRDETLSFADGMTVVFGNNESAKSSWHAAIFAALCGRRRGKGKPRADEQSFIDLHKPWDHEDWLVTSQIILDDGRNIEMRQDLAGKVDCHAKDLGLGRDVSSEIMNDGAPDASEWLGLDRSSFVATACVEQGQMRRVRDDAAGLQDHLQRAAATAGSAATAAKALGRIDDYLRERVGHDRANSTKPLRTAQLYVERAQRVLEERTEAHEEYVSRVARAEELRKMAAAAAAKVCAYEAAAAVETAAELTKRTSRAKELYAKYGTTAPPSALDDDDLARQVSEALTEWRSRPEASLLPERSSAKLEEEIDALPAPPQGDTEPHSSVLTAIDRVKHASAQLELQAKSRPSATASAPQVSADDDELLDLARTLETPVPSIPRELVEREAAARNAVNSARSRGPVSMVLIVAGAAIAALALLLLTTVGLAVGIAVVVMGTGLSIAGAALRLSGATASSARKLAEVQTTLQTAQTRRAEMARRHEQALARCAQLGIPADPAALRAVPVARAHAAAHQHDAEEWANQHATLRSQASAAAAHLSEALAARGHTPSGRDEATLLADATNYQQACRDNTAQAANAARRGDLVRQLSDTKAAEVRSTGDQVIRARATDLVISTAGRCGIACATAEDAIASMYRWLEQRTDRLDELATKQQEWAELHTLLDSKSLVELEESSRLASARAQQLGAADSALLAPVVASSAAEQLPALRQEASQAETKAAAEEGELRLFAASMGNVSEAEEDLSRAEDELERLQQLKETLELTRKFLKDAQDRVHRDIAPLLAATLKDWLPTITDDRYTDVMVDPESLLVQVCGKSRRWRRADLLSYGTAEQVYLLLRVALADHLTRGHDTCPLLLDDATVHADAARTRDILNLLLRVADNRQVVVFTQEEQVATWARENLTNPQHTIRELTPIEVA